MWVWSLFFPQITFQIQGNAWTVFSIQTGNSSAIIVALFFHTQKKIINIAPVNFTIKSPVGNSASDKNPALPRFVWHFVQVIEWANLYVATSTCLTKLCGFTDGERHLITASVNEIFPFSRAPPNSSCSHGHANKQRRIVLANTEVVKQLPQPTSSRSPC